MHITYLAECCGKEGTQKMAIWWPFCFLPKHNRKGNLLSVFYCSVDRLYENTPKTKRKEEEEGEG
jgi:hypothetical protein